MKRRFSEENQNPNPWEVGVHDGFDDLYNRPVEQRKGAERSPRQVRQILSPELCLACRLGWWLR
jgi:hypothetical protein